ncbi:unnamed protein product [Phytophthora fragariaefolia]|uniref:Unnamed protein product n=1 Tax=Phytophthora fragariaefolia TaxID=1490495 RepID=A0A9W6XZQ3_9STRA|nr:unnamed protein product [Phytophthora fragariaefolia]
MDLAIKYEMTHFGEQARDLQHCHDKKKPWVDRAPSNGKPYTGKRSEKKVGSSLSRNPSVLKIEPASQQETWSQQGQLFPLKNKELEKQGNGQPRQ